MGESCERLIELYLRAVRWWRFAYFFSFFAIFIDDATTSFMHERRKADTCIPFLFPHVVRYPP